MADKTHGLAFDPAKPPIITSIWDLAPEALQQMGQWMAQNLPASLPIAQLQGYGQLISSSRVVTGQIPATGTTPTAGSGFTYTHASTGIYVFTFSPAFAAAPTITFGLNGTTHNATPNISSRTASGFTVTWASTSGTVTNVAFDFIAATTA